MAFLLLSDAASLAHLSHVDGVPVTVAGPVAGCLGILLLRPDTDLQGRCRDTADKRGSTEGDPRRGGGMGEGAAALDATGAGAGAAAMVLGFALASGVSVQQGQRCGYIFEVGGWSSDLFGTRHVRSKPTNM